MPSVSSSKAPIGIEATAALLLVFRLRCVDDAEPVVASISSSPCADESLANRCAWQQCNGATRHWAPAGAFLVIAQMLCEQLSFFSDGMMSLRGNIEQVGRLRPLVASQYLLAAPRPSDCKQG